MKKLLATVFVLALSLSAFAGAGGVVVKGALKTWDEIAKMALKASGKSMSDDAVKAAAKTIEEASAKYGDDVATAAMRGGVEIAEQSLKRGAKYVSLLKSASSCSDDAMRALARNADDILRLSRRHGDDILKLIASSEAPESLIRGIARAEKAGLPVSTKTIETLATKIPPEDISRVFGAIEKNPGVAKEFLDGVTQGGKAFVDKVFELNGKTILAGGLSAAAIISAIRLTAPAAADAESTRKMTQKSIDIVDKGGPSTPAEEKFVDRWTAGTNVTRFIHAAGFWGIGIVLAVFAGVSLLVFAILKGRANHHGSPKSNSDVTEKDVA